MAHLFQKQPENALKAARGLLNIPNVDGAAIKRNKRSALEKLGEALVAKKNRTWQPVHEELMVLYLDLCLDLQLGRIAKDGLHQYRNLSIQTNPASLETVILHFVKLTEQKLALAKRESTELILQAAAAVDLEAAQTPEAVMLSTTSFDSSSDRTDREVVVPWLRFTWETYRTVLDILKNNSKLEALYQTVALQAFDFCVEYTRKIEFRRLCEILRNHLGALQKHTAVPTTQSTRQMRAWDGFTLDTVERLLVVRYRQLQVASLLELFSEAFRTIDDINTIMNLVDQVPRLELMVTYYDKLAHIFLVSKNHLFHAFALYKWYALRVAGLAGLEGSVALGNTGAALVSTEEQTAMATRVVLAALSVPLVDFDAATPSHTLAATAGGAAVTSTLRLAPTSEKHTRMAALLGFSTAPTRAQLLEDVQVSGVLARASPTAASLFQHLEQHEVDPLQIVGQVAPLLQDLQSEYADAVERLVVRRVLFQLTRVYASVTLAHLKSLFVGLRVSYEEIEQLIVRSRSLSTVAHAAAPSLTSLYLKNAASSSSSIGGDVTVATALRTKIRIDHVQQCVRFSEAVEVEAHPQQLTQLGARLATVLAKVQPSQDNAAQKTLAATARTSLAETRHQLLARREIIERKKEELEKLQQEKLKSLEKKRQEQEAARVEAEKTRLEMDAKRREAERLQKIKDEIALKETRQILEKIGRTDLDDAELATLDRDALLNEAREKAQKAKEEAQKKLRDAARRLDYIIRATREAEQPILHKLVDSEKAVAKQTHEQQSQAKLTAAKSEHAAALQEKARLVAALPVATVFVAAHVARRKELYKKQAEEHAKKSKLERLERRVAHAKQRYEDEQEEIRAYEVEQERTRREVEAERERERQVEIEAELRRQEEEEAQRRKEEEEEEQQKRQEEEAQHRQRTEGDDRSGAGARFGGGLRSRRGEDDREWTSVGARGGGAPRSAAPEGRWGRAGPPARDAPSSGLRRGVGGDRDEGESSSGGSALSRAFGSSGGSGLRRGFGGDREDAAPRRSFGFGGDRERDGEREGGLRRGGFGGDRERDGERDGGLRRGGFGGDRERDGERDGGLRRGGFGGDRDGERDGGLRRGGFGGDRERGEREGAYRPPREGEPRREPSSRAPDSGRWR